MREHGQGVGPGAAPRIRYCRICCRVIGRAILHRIGPIRRLPTRATAARSGTRRTEGRGKEVKTCHRISNLTTWGKGRCSTGATREVCYRQGGGLGVELIDRDCLRTIMAAKADTPVIDPANGIGDGVASTVRRSTCKVGRVISCRVATTLVEGQDGHLIPRPARCRLRGNVAFFAWEMIRYRIWHRSGFFEPSLAIVTRIGVTELALSDQGVSIVRVMRGRHGRSMAGSTGTTAVISGRGASRHGLRPSIGGPQLTSLGGGIKLMASKTVIMDLTVNQTNRNSTGSTSGRGVTGDASCRRLDHGGMIRCRMTGRRAGTIDRHRRIMMNTSGRICCGWVTCQTGRTTSQSRCITQQSTTISSGKTCASSSRIDMTETTAPAMDCCNNIRTRMTGRITGGITDKVSWVMTSMASRPIGMTVKAGYGRAGHDDIVN